MKIRFVSALAFALVLGAAANAQDAAQPSRQPEGNWGQRGDHMGAGGWGGRGIVGAVTEVAADHYTIKTETGDIYTVHFSANTRIVKQPAQAQGGEGQRTPPEPIKPAGIKVGDAIMTMGEVDQAAKSVGAVMVMQLDPERAKQMREMQANFGKTWLAGRVTAIDDAKITLQGGIDNSIHAFVADENTTFRKRRDPIALADIQVGDNVRVEGSVKNGVFVAASVAVMPIQARGGPAPPAGDEPRK
jgi:hypothetical protein